MIKSARHLAQLDAAIARAKDEEFRPFVPTAPQSQSQSWTLSLAMRDYLRRTWFEASPETFAREAARMKPDAKLPGGLVCSARLA